MNEQESERANEEKRVARAVSVARWLADRGLIDASSIDFAVEAMLESHDFA